MVDDNGHEPRRLDRDWVEDEVRRGGALVTVEVRTLSQRWAGKRIVSNLEMEDSYLTRTNLVTDVVRRIVDTINIETRKR